MAQQNQGGATNDLKKGAQVTMKAAKSAKAAAKAVSKAAGGNYVGAAVEVLKDENFRKIIAILLVIHFFIVFCAVFLLPLALIEAVVAYVKEVKERWLEHYYDGGSSLDFLNAVSATALTAVDVVVDFATAAWDWVTGWFTSDEDEADDAEDEPGEEDMGIYSRKNDLRSVYIRKIETTQKKFTRRQLSLAEELVFKNRKVADYLNNRAKQYVQDQGIEPYTGNPNVPHVEYEEVDYVDPVIVVLVEPISKENIAALICLHTMQVQNEDSENQSKLSGYMKWLGYGKSSKDLNFAIKTGDTEIKCDVKAQKGGFMPQYLIDERDARKNALDKDDEDGRAEIDEIYEEYACSAIDFVTRVEIPDLATLEPEVRSVSKDIYHYQVRPAPLSVNGDGDSIIKMANAPTDDQKKYGWVYATNCVIHASDDDNSGENLISYGDYGAAINMKYLAEIYENNSNDYGKNPGPHNYYYNPWKWKAVTWYGTTHLYRKSDLSYQIDPSAPKVKVTHVKMRICFRVTVRIKCADLETIIDLTGLYRGFTPTEMANLGISTNTFESDP